MDLETSIDGGWTLEI